MANIKTLKVCLSRDLPSLQDRDSNTIYFLRDKLIIYLGKSMYHDPYAIVEDIPDEPISGLLYFLLTDGTVRAFVEYQVVTIAQIENNDQLELLKQTGSVFFVNSQRRYLDLQRRIVTLPYNNGTYELTVDMANSLKINEKTIIGFNPATNMFEMVGDRYDEPIFNYQGKKSNSIDTVITDKRITSEVRISEVYDNIIRIANDGLYANVKDRVTKTQFDSWANSFKEYKAYMESYLRSLTEKIEENEQKVSGSTIRDKILEALEAQYPTIEYALTKFAEYTEQFRRIETRVKTYADEKFEEIYTVLLGQIVEATSNPWEEFAEEETEDTNTEIPLEESNDNSGTERNVSGNTVNDESIPENLNSDYAEGSVGDPGTTNDAESGDDTTPIENNSSAEEQLVEEVEVSFEDNIRANYNSEEIKYPVVEESQVENKQVASEITESDTFTSNSESELSKTTDNTNTSTEEQTSDENAENP